MTIDDTKMTEPMSKEEMIDTLKGLVFGTFDRTTAKEREALDMAIKALEQQPCEDCISRQQAIDKMQELEDEDIKAYGCEIPESFDGKRAIRALKTLPSVTPNARWIPVSERLPKAGEYVEDVARYYLVQNEYGDMLVARYTHSGYWEQIYQLKPIGDEIVAWMPLPTPYSESEVKE